MNVLPVKKIITLFLFITCLFSAMGCTTKTETLSKSGFYFNTIITITLYGETNEKVLEECMDIAKKYENLFSKTVKDSDIWRINHSQGSSVTVESETIDLLSIALEYAARTNGLVDPTIGGVSSLWDFSAETKKQPPNKDAITDALTHVNYKNISFDKNTVQLADPHTQIDLGFIAKGYIADQIKAYLVSQDIKSGIINLGGNVVTVGSRIDGSAFQIGIQEPFSPTKTALTSLPISDGSVVTSGIYERYFESDGTLYHHTLNTKTGYPIKNNLLSVTIISKSSVDGDALSTTCMALGLTDSIALIESLSDTEALFVTQGNVIHVTTGLQ